MFKNRIIRSRSSTIQPMIKLDAMALQGLQLAAKVQTQPLDSQLQSQTLSPTKLKLTRNKMFTSTPKVIELPPPPAEEICLRWNSHHSNMQTSFPHLLQMEKYVDVTLIAEGKSLKCHRMILSSCSPYFEEILSGINPLQHPVIILNGVPFWILKMLTDFMYIGEVNIDQNKVPQLLDVAEILKVKGLASKNSSADKDKIKTENNIPKKSIEKNVNKQLPNMFSAKPPTISPVEEPVLDPLQLLETKFLEIPMPKQKKIINKKFRKRKSSDDESTPSPPVFPIRRGTRSRPYVKVPKCYDYEDIVKPMRIDSPQDSNNFSPVHIKSEPIDEESNNSQNGQANFEEASEYSDINNIANKLQTLEKGIEIEQISPTPKKFLGKSMPYKIKLKKLSSMSETVEAELPLIDKDMPSDLSNKLYKNEDNDASQNSSLGTSEPISNNTSAIDNLEDKTDQCPDETIHDEVVNEDVNNPSETLEKINSEV